MLAFMAGFLIITCISLFLRPMDPDTAEQALRRSKRLWCAWLIKILGVHIRQHGTAMPQCGLLVCNHISWLDIIVLGAQGQFSFVSKHEVAEWPVVGYLAERAGTLFLRRGNRDSARDICNAMTQRLNRGEYMAFFPEGTSSTGSSVLRFHNRLFQVAIDAGVQVQATALAYRGTAHTVVPFVGDDEFLPHLWQVLALPEIQVDLFFCEPISTEHQDRKALAEHTRAQITEALQLV